MAMAVAIILMCLAFWFETVPAASAGQLNVTYGSLCTSRRHFCWNATHYTECDDAYEYTETINLATYNALKECDAGSVCNLDGNSKLPCLMVHRDYVRRLATILAHKREQHQLIEEHLSEHMGGGLSEYPNLQSIASLLVAPQVNRPPPDNVPDIPDEVAFLSELPSFPILRPNRRPTPTAAEPAVYQDDDFGEWSDETPPDEQKPVETAAEPFRCRFFGRYAHPTDCRRYYQCHGSGTAFTERTCDDGLTFNSRWLRCESDWSNCKDIPWCKSDHQVLPDFRDKNHYFICVRRSYLFFVEDYSIFRRSCPTGQVFSLQKQGCQEPHLDKD